MPKELVRSLPSEFLLHLLQDKAWNKDSFERMTIPILNEIEDIKKKAMGGSRQYVAFRIANLKAAQELSYGKNVKNPRVGKDADGKIWVMAGVNKLFVDPHSYSRL